MKTDTIHTIAVTGTEILSQTLVAQLCGVGLGAVQNYSKRNSDKVSTTESFNQIYIEDVFQYIDFYANKSKASNAIAKHNFSLLMTMGLERFLFESTDYKIIVKLRKNPPKPREGYVRSQEIQQSGRASDHRDDKKRAKSKPKKVSYETQLRELTAQYKEARAIQIEADIAVDKLLNKIDELHRTNK